MYKCKKPALAMGSPSLLHEVNNSSNKCFEGSVKTATGGCAKLVKYQQPTGFFINTAKPYKDTLDRMHGESESWWSWCLEAEAEAKATRKLEGIPSSQWNGVANKPTVVHSAPWKLHPSVICGNCSLELDALVRSKCRGCRVAR